MTPIEIEEKIVDLTTSFVEILTTDLDAFYTALNTDKKFKRAMITFADNLITAFERAQAIIDKKE